MTQAFPLKVTLRQGKRARCVRWRTNSFE